MSVAPIESLAPEAIPAAVRAGGPDAVAGFRAALSFEKVMLDKLLAEALPEEDEGAPRAASLAETISSALVAGGGAGIATDLYGSPS
jgi:hypothetical protein